VLLRCNYIYSNIFIVLLMVIQRYGLLQNAFQQWVSIRRWCGIDSLLYRIMPPFHDDVSIYNMLCCIRYLALPITKHPVFYKACMSWYYQHFTFGENNFHTDIVPFYPYFHHSDLTFIQNNSCNNLTEFSFEGVTIKPS
jgi:hypothetical protein